MKKKLFFATGLLAVVAAVGMTGSVNFSSTKAEGEADLWTFVNSDPEDTIENVDGGVRASFSDGYTRAYRTVKVHVDGLSFTYHKKGLQYDCAQGFGWCFEEDPASNPAIADDSIGFYNAFWGDSQDRISLRTHSFAWGGNDYTGEGACCYGEMDKASTQKDLGSYAGYSSFELNAGTKVGSDYPDAEVTERFTFEKVNDSWYKMTVYGNYTQVSPMIAYNWFTGAENGFYTYIPVEKLPLDGNGNTYLSMINRDKYTGGYSEILNIESVKYETADWDMDQKGANTVVTDVKNGYEIAGLDSYGVRIGNKIKTKLDGLSFKVKTHDLADSVGDCLGVYIQGSDSTHAYYTETSAMVYSFWSQYGQMRNVFSDSHNYSTTKCYSDMTKSTPDGMSDANGNLINTWVEDYEQTLKFEKVDDTWYKLTILGDKIWSSNNYNAVGGESAFTYFKAADAGVDEDGEVYICAFGLNPTAPHKPVLTISNIRNASVQKVGDAIEGKMSAFDIDYIEASDADEIAAVALEYETASDEAKVYVSSDAVESFELCAEKCALLVEAEPFKAAIDEIPVEITLTKECHDKIVAAREAYDDLSDDAKTVVEDEYEVLEDAETEYKEGMDDVKAREVGKLNEFYAKIDKNSYTDENKQKVQDAYNKALFDIDAAETEADAVGAEQTAESTINAVEKIKKGCGGAVISSILGVTAMVTALGCILIAKKRKED